MWRGAGPTGSDADGVYGRRHKSDGTAIDSAEFLINVTTGGGCAEIEDQWSRRTGDRMRGIEDGRGPGRT